MKWFKWVSDSPTEVVDIDAWHVSLGTIVAFWLAGVSKINQHYDRIVTHAYRYVGFS